MAKRGLSCGRLVLLGSGGGGSTFIQVVQTVRPQHISRRSRRGFSVEGSKASGFEVRRAAHVQHTDGGGGMLTSIPWPMMVKIGGTVDARMKVKEKEISTVQFIC